MRRFLRLKAVLEVTGLTRSSLYELVKAGAFPPPIPLSMRSVAWDVAEVEAWMAARVAARDEMKKPSLVRTRA